MSAQYFAQLDENNVVTHVAVVEKSFMDANPDRYPGVWQETFFDTAGKTYAGVGFTWDGTDFVAPVVPDVVVEGE